MPSVSQHKLCELWFRNEESYWRTLASLIWCIPLLEVLIAAFILATNFSLLAPYTWIAGSISTCFSLLFVVNSAAIFTSLMVTSFVYRITAQVEVQPVQTKLRELFKFFLPRHLLVLIIFSGSGLITAHLLNLLNDLHLSVWTISEVGSTHGLSDKPLFICMYGLMLGLQYAITYFNQHRYVIKFPQEEETRLAQLKKIWQPCVKENFRINLLFMRNFYPLYLLVGFIPRHVIKSVAGLPFICEESLWKLILNLVDIRLFFTCLCLGVLILTTWDILLELFKIFNTQHFSFPIDSNTADDQHRTISNALKGPSSLLKYLAFYDLCLTSKSSSERRMKIFKLSAPGNQPHTLNAIIEECLSLIVGTRDRLTAACAKKQPTTTTAMPLSPIPAEYIGVQQLFSPNKTNSDRLSEEKHAWWASPGKLLHRKVTASPCHTPSIQDVEPANKPDSPKKVKSVDSSHEELLSNIPLLVWAIEGLSNIVAASITDDIYGATQRKLPEIISSLISLLETTERFTKVAVVPPSQFFLTQLEVTQKNCLQATTLKTVLNTAIQTITSAFGSHISAIKLDASSKKRLENFLVDEK